MSHQKLCKFLSRWSRSVNIHLKALNNQRCNQPDHDTRFWYHGSAASKECLQAPPPFSSPDRSGLAPLDSLFFRPVTRSGTCSQATKMQWGGNWDGFVYTPRTNEFSDTPQQENKNRTKPFLYGVFFFIGTVISFVPQLQTIEKKPNNNNWEA